MIDPTEPVVRDADPTPTTAYERLCLDYTRSTDGGSLEGDYAMFLEMLSIKYSTPRDAARRLKPSRQDLFDYSAMAAARGNPFHGALRFALGHEPQQAIGSAHSWLAGYIFWCTGRKTFVVEPALSKMLVDTELKTPAQLIQLPFECVYLVWRQLGIRLLNSQDGTELPVEGVFVYRGVTSNRIGAYPAWWFVFVSCADPTSRSPDLACNVLFGSIEESFLYRDELLLEASVDDYLRKTVIADHHGPEVRDTLAPLVTLAINTITYINSAGADLEHHRPHRPTLVSQTTNKKKQRRLAARALRSSVLPYILVGRSVSSAKATTEAHSAGPFRMMTYRFDVRGHWRTYWKLEENLTAEERSALTNASVTRPSPTGAPQRPVLKWVPPHQRGPDTAEKIHRTYRVEAPG